MGLYYYEEYDKNLIKEVVTMFEDGNSFLTIAEELCISEDIVMDIITDNCNLP